MEPETSILIVDDDEGNLDILEATIEDLGARVLRACDGVQALEIARRERLDVIVTDILMPNMDGYQLCRELAADPELKSIPLIFYSATYTDREDRDFALALGAARFVRKPVSPAVIEQVISEVLAEREGSEPAPTRDAILDEKDYLTRYNKRLVAKLEDKLNQLSEVNRRLEEEIERKTLAEHTVRQLAYSDPLTGLPNRTRLLERLEDIFASAAADGTSIALMVVDLDYFSEINHTLGHVNGNLLLRLVAARLDSLLPIEGALLVRLGGDDFAVVLSDIRDRRQAIERATELMKGLDVSFDLDGLPVRVTASIGISVYPEHGTDGALLLRHAEVALRQARGSRGMVSIFAPDDDPYEPGRLSLIGGLRQAIRGGQLVLHYQPKVDLATGRTVGAEALARWNHPQQGLLAPAAFVRLAEQTGEIRALTRWLLHTGLRDYTRWRYGGLDLNLSLNLSARNLLDDDLPDELYSIVEEEGIHEPHLTLEITESAILQDPQRARSNLERFAAMGVTVAIDDFGTGYSSLSNLKLLPVSELKIDKSFVMDIVDDQDDATIVHSTIDLAHSLGLQATAEGVESVAIHDRLVDLGCDMAQGFLMSRPIPSADFLQWARQSRWGVLVE